MPGGSYPCKPGCACGRHRHSQKPPAYLASGMKTCSNCDTSKPVAEFNVAGQGKHGPVYSSWCKRCNAGSSYIRMRRHTFENKYGISLERYEEMLAAQGNACAICGNAEMRIQNGKVRLLSVDHDHVTGKVRGLLCNNCNRAIGLLGDDTDTLKRAIYYLQRGSG